MQWQPTGTALVQHLDSHEVTPSGCSVKDGLIRIPLLFQQNRALFPVGKCLFGLAFLRAPFSELIVASFGAHQPVIRAH